MLTDYEKKYAVYAVIGEIVAYFVAKGLKFLLEMLPCFGDTLTVAGAAIGAVHSLLTPGLLILTLFIVLAIYKKNLEKGGDK